MKTKETIRKSEKTRRFIIEKCASVFNKKGIAGTSLTDITNETGLTKGSIYGNFRDKNDVAVAIFEYNVEVLNSFLNRALDKQSTYVDKLLAVPEAYRRLYRNIVDFGGCPIANTAIEVDDTMPEIRKLTTRTIEEMTDGIQNLIERGKVAGEIQHLVDSKKTAAIIFSLIEGGIILSKATRKKHYLMSSLEQVDYLVHSIRVQDKT